MEWELQVEKEVTGELAALRIPTRSSLDIPSQQSARDSSPLAEIEELPTSEVVAKAAKMSAAIKKMAVSSKHLKGTFVRGFKEAAAGLEEAVRVVAARTNSDGETRRLEASNRRLMEDVAELRDTVAYLRADRGAVQAKLDSVTAENGTLRAEADALHEELRDLRRDLTEMRMARLKKGKEGKWATGAPARPSPSVPSVQRGGDSDGGETWSQVVRRGGKRSGARGGSAAAPAPPSKGQGGRAAAAGGKQSLPKAKLAKPPRCAAVTLSVTDPNTKLGEVMARIRGQIDPRAFGIDAVRPRRAVTGALLIEIPGEDNEAKADKLAAAMSPLAEEMGAKVSRPTKTVELRIRGLEDSISSDEVREAVAAAGCCRPTEVKVGRARASPGGLQSVWAQCPLAAARKVVAGGALKGNLNHARGAQDLMIQSLAELGGVMAVVAEPYSVPDHPSWFGSEDGSAAIHFRYGSDPESSVFSPLERGRGLVVAQWGELVVVGGYFSPNRPFQEFERYLDELERVALR
ncbi:uncharacterized protein LOC109863171, partial [Pseudomyrmex gracilis]|uniref:uncharacterized protein LOC109863171 n=1 Tax=Pseudomyrmex gracilis TaxID=219809 RepID=UPI0009953FF9